MDQPDDSILVPSSPSFESLKKYNQNDVEYWSARDLQPCLGYSHWRDFKNAIKKAMESCKQSRNNSDHHFAGARKPIPGGKGSSQIVEDYHLSRFACYLIAQNGDPRKPEIAQAQKYFAIQTRRQEISDQMAADDERRFSGAFRSSQESWSPELYVRHFSRCWVQRALRRARSRRDQSQEKHSA